MSSDNNNIRNEIAQQFIDAIEKGAAPWQKPWDETVGSQFNPTSQSSYRGINQLHLALVAEKKGYTDPRWMTYRQAQEQGAQVRKGEKSTPVEYWKWEEKIPVMDDNGQPRLDENGEKVMLTAKLERPEVFYARVFNASQIEGLPEFTPPKVKFDPIERAESVILSMGVIINESNGARAFYRPSDHAITMPRMESFKDAYGYYSTALHELGHATGHDTLLARDFGNVFGSTDYAREELRAEIASYMVAKEIGLAHDPSRHAGYVESWLKVLKEDPNEIFRASRDAEKIKTYILEPEKREELVKAAQATRQLRAEAILKFHLLEAEKREKLLKSAQAVGEVREQAKQETTVEGKNPKVIPTVVNAQTAKEEVKMDKQKETKEIAKVYLAVPYAEKEQAKAVGARWDRAAKSWYVREGADMDAVKSWIATEQPAKLPPVAIDPKAEFAQFARDHGLHIDNLVMDGKWRRVKVAGDRGIETSGTYRGFTDGRPSGQLQNHRVHKNLVTWVAQGQALDEKARAKLRAEAADLYQKRDQELAETRKQAAQTAQSMLKAAAPAPDTHPYLQNKQVAAHGLKLGEDGKLLMPLYNADGEVQSLQAITDGGQKRLLKGGQKGGGFYPIDPEGKMANGYKGAILVAEGYATAASLHQATGLPTIAAVDAGNLKPVAEALQQKHPKAALVIAADNDHQRENNPGLTKATLAAKAVKGVAVAPKFTDAEKADGLTDFNDLAAARGLKAVQDELKSHLPKQQTRKAKKEPALVA